MRLRSIISIVATFALVGGLAACSTTNDNSAIVPTDSSQLKGKEITLLIHPTLFAATGDESGQVADFEKETGVKVNVVKAGLPDLYNKLNVEFAAQTGTYDVFVWDDGVAEPGWWSNLLPVNELLTKEDQSDFISALLAANTDSDGKLYGVPFRASGYIMYYRKDLLEAAGYSEFPEDAEDFMDAARAMTHDGVVGLVQMGTNPEIAVEFTSYLYAYGGRLLDDSNKTCALESDKAIEAADNFLDIYQEISPPEYRALSRDDYIAAFAKGRTAMSMFVSSYYGRLIDPNAGSIGADQVGAALLPSANGVAPGTARLSLWAMGINKNSKEPQAAAALVKYLTSADAQVRGAVDYANGPVRNSTFADPEYREFYPYADLLKEALSLAIKDPAIPQTNAIRNALSSALQEAISEDSSGQEAMSNACQRINRELSR